MTIYDFFQPDSPNHIPEPGYWWEVKTSCLGDVKIDTEADRAQVYCDDDKFYVLVRKDLSPGQQLAQAGHACASYARWNPDSGADVRPIVVLAVNDERHLLDMSTTRSATGHYMWHELGYGVPQYTALAVVSDGADFAELPLAGNDSSSRTNLSDVEFAIDYLSSLGKKLRSL